MSNERIRECQQCGSKYEFCIGCGDYYQNFWSYRQICCSSECYQEFEKKRLGIIDEVIDVNTEEIIEEVVDMVIKK